MFAQAEALDSLEVKRIREMLPDKIENAILALDQVGAHEVAVIVAVHVDLPQNKIGTMLGADLQDVMIGAQKHHSGQGNARFAAFGISLVELGALYELRVVHVHPGMILAVNPDMVAAPFDQIRTQILDLNMRIHLVLAVGRLLALVELSHLGGMIGDVQIAIFIAIVNAAIATVYLRGFGHIDVQQLLAVQFDFIDGQIGRGRDLLGIVDGGDEVFP